ncbi:MAG: hypothetical protein AAF703_10120 [Cyanobacteria bacterium P01_D01_bin.105]
MKFFKRSSSVLATASLLLVSAPALANPFMPSVDGIFITPEVPLTPTVPAPTASATTSQSEDVGNSEVQGLGDHDSWVSQEVLADDPRALCSDVGLGNNTYASSNRASSSSSNRTRTSSSNASSREGSGGVSVLWGLGSGGGGGAGSSRARNSSDQSNRERQSNASSVETSTVVVGQNCDAFVEAAAARDMNYEDNLTERYSIRVNRRGQQVDGLLGR